MLAARPDVVMIEFAVNDPAARSPAKHSKDCCVRFWPCPIIPPRCMLFTMNDQGQNVQREHSRVGRHYRVPMVSFRDAVWPDIASGKVSWNDIEADSVHPNDRGHQICGALVSHLFDMAAETLPA